MGKKKGRKAVCVGSFDSPTNGHEWLIREGSKFFDELVVGIGTNPEKEYTFTLDERVGMLEEMTKDLPNVSIDTFEHKLAVKYAKEVGADYILRGTRSDEESRKEREMSYANRDIDPDILTVTFSSPLELTYISSSFVKDFVGFEGWEEIVKRYVPEPVYQKFLKKFGDPEE